MNLKARMGATLIGAALAFTGAAAAAPSAFAADIPASAAIGATAVLPAGTCTLTAVCTGPAAPPPVGHDRQPTAAQWRSCLGWGFTPAALGRWVGEAAGPLGWIVVAGSCIDTFAGPQ